MEAVRRSSRSNAGARMNDVTVQLPVLMKRLVAMWLIFGGYLFFNLPARPLAQALKVDDGTVLAAFRALRGDDGDQVIRRVARDLQTFVRKEWPRLQHRFDMATFALRYRLPLVDVRFWLQEHPDDWAFLLYEDSGPVMERLQILEAMEDSTSVQLSLRRHAVCALCGMELFPDMVRWRSLIEHERRFKPPPREPEDMSVHVVRKYSRGGKERVSVCSNCKTRDAALPVPFLDPIPQEVLAVPIAFRHYLATLSLWMKRDHGQGFAKVIGMTSCASRALNLKHQTSTLGIFLSSIRPDELLRKNAAEGQRITGLLQTALRALIDSGCLVLRHLFSMYELGLSSVAIADKAELADDATGHVAPQLQRKDVGPAQIILPDYDAGQEDPNVERMIGQQQNRVLPSTETGSGNSSDGGVSVHIGVLSQDDKAAEVLNDDKMDFATMQDPYWLEKLFPWLFPQSRGGFAKPTKTWGWTIGQFTKWAILNHDHRFRNCAEFVFALLDRKFTEMIIGANANTGGMYKETAERDVPTVREANDFFQRFSWLPPSIPGSESYFKAKKRTLFAIRAYRKCEASVFVTMTFSPHWPEVLEMVKRNGGGNYWQYPGDCAVIFYNHLRQIQQYLWGDKSVFGGADAVVDHWMRVEEQGRWGGLHVHLLMWLSPAALEQLPEIVRATMPPPGHPLRDIVQQLHVHKHTLDYCGGAGKCRFGYAQPESDETILHVRDLPPSKSVFLRPVNGKGAIQRVLYKRGPEDVNVVPYVPLLLARWQAQCNVEIVLQAGSKNKSRKPGDMSRNEDLQDYAAAAPIYHYASKGDAPLRFKKLTESQKYSRFRVLTSMMACYTALGYPLAVSSRTSLYIPTGLCDRRRRKLLSKKMQPKDEDAPAEFADGLIDKYMKRPAALQWLSFLHVCAWFEVERTKTAAGGKRPEAVIDQQEEDFGHAGEADDDDKQDEDKAEKEEAVSATADGNLLFPQKVEQLGGIGEYERATRSEWGSTETGFDFENCALTRVYGSGTSFSSANGKLLFRLRKEFKLVSWVFSAPSEGELFYHTFAMLAFPFWGDELPTIMMREMFANSPTPFQSFCERHFPDVFRPRTAVELAANLLALQRADGARAGTTARKLAAGTAAQISSMAATALNVDGIDAAIVFAEGLLGTSDEAQQKATTTLLQHLYWRRGAPSLNVDQIKIFHHIVDTVVAGEPLTLCTLGGGGTGKSLLIRHVVFELTVRHKKTVIVAATTGTAAAALGGMTMHAVFGFDITLKADLQPGTSKWFQLGKFDLLICDECSMMSCQMFDAAATALRLVRGTEESEAAFGGASFWLLGDFKQLDAVDTQEERAGVAERQPAPFLFHSPLFAQFEVTFLTINERAQKDPLFAHLLDRVSRGELDDFDRQILRSRICASLITEDNVCWATTTVADAPHIISQSPTDVRNFFFAGRVDGAALRLHANCRIVCHHGDFAKCIGPLRPFAILTGRKAVRDIVNNQALYYYPNGLSVAEGAPAPDWRKTDARDYMAIDCALADFAQGVKPPAVDDAQQIAAMSKVSQYPRQLRLKPGMPVLIVRNYDLERQICNGSRAIYLDDSTKGLNPNHSTTLVQIRLQHSGDIESLKREVDRSEKVKMVRSQFALISAFAASVHKAQGISEDQIVTSLGVAHTAEGEVDPDAPSDMFAPSQAYVALSRSRTLHGVHLLAFDAAAIHVRQEVLDFYNKVEAPPTTPMYTKTYGDAKVAFTTWRYKVCDFSTPDPKVPKRPRSAPSSPQPKGFNDDIMDENGVVNTQLLKKRLLQQPKVNMAKPPVRRLFGHKVQSLPSSPPRQHRSFLLSLLDNYILQEDNSEEALTQKEDECELSPQKLAEMIEREEKAAQIKHDQEFAEALQQQEQQQQHDETDAEREARLLARKHELEQAFRNGTHRNLNPTIEGPMQDEIAAGRGYMLDSLRLDGVKVFNFTLNAYCGVVRSFLMDGLADRVVILGVDFVAYSRLDLDVIGSCQVFLDQFQYVLIPTLMGGHFFLFCVFRYAGGAAQILSFDSLAGANPAQCFAAHQFPKVIQYLGLAHNTPCVIQQCPQQPNGTDCGVFTIFNLRVMVNVLSEWHVTRQQNETFPVQRLGPLNVDQRAPSSVARTRVFRCLFVNELLNEALEDHPVFDPQLYIRD